MAGQNTNGMSKILAILKGFVSEKTIQVICVVGAVCLLLPSTLITLYTYPVQDDFANALTAKSYMAQGHGLLEMTFHQTWEYFLHYSGYYASLLFTFFFSGLIDCSVWGIRIFQFVVAILYHISILFLVYAILVHLLEISRKMVMPVYFLLTICRTCLYYYIENEDMYWFCASVIYLTLLIFVFVGSALLIYAIKTKRRRYLVLSIICSFFIGGAVLNVTAFGCFLYLLISFWGIVIKKQTKYSLIGFGSVFVFSLTNAFCPANFERRGTAVTLEDVWDTFLQSIYYVVERLKMFLLEYPVFDAVLVILTLVLLCQRWDNIRYKFRLPLLFTIVAFGGIVLLVFPVMLGYGAQVYSLMERCNFVSDFGIALFAFAVIFYWRGWLGRIAPQIYISLKYKWVVMAVMVFALLVGTKLQRLGNVPVVRQTKEIINGSYSEYADFCVGVYEKIESTEGEVIEIEIPWVEDETCLIGACFVTGYHDPDATVGNGTLARYYGKRAIYMFAEE